MFITKIWFILITMNLLTSNYNNKIISIWNMSIVQILRSFVRNYFLANTQFCVFAIILVSSHAVISHIMLQLCVYLVWHLSIQENPPHSIHMRSISIRDFFPLQFRIMSLRINSMELTAFIFIAFFSNLYIYTHIDIYSICLCLPNIFQVVPLFINGTIFLTHPPKIHTIQEFVLKRLMNHCQNDIQTLH